MKLFIQTMLGIVALLAGVALLYFFLSRLSSGFSYIFLILSIVLIGVSAFLFFKVSKIANFVPEASVEVPSTESGSKLLEKNNQMVEAWNKTNRTNDTLKTIQMEASAQITEPTK